MNSTVFLTVLSGVLTFVLGELVLKLVIEPVQEMKKLIGQVAHSLTEHANVIQNSGALAEDKMRATSDHLRKLSAHLEAQLYLVPAYPFTASVFRLPSTAKVIDAAGALIGLSNGLFHATNGIHEQNVERVNRVRGSLGLYRASR